MSKSKENKSVRFVAISSDNNIKYENILYSYDGKNWLLNSERTGAAIDSDGSTVVYGNNLWLAGETEKELMIVSLILLMDYFGTVLLKTG